MTFAQLILFLLFAILNLLILFKIKARTDLIIAIITSHLIVILLFNITFNSLVALQEMVLAVGMYSISILFLISGNYSQHGRFFPQKTSSQVNKSKGLAANQQNSSKNLSGNFSTTIAAALLCFVLAAAVAIILVIHEVPQINSLITEKRTKRQQDAAVNPMILPSHPVHIAVKKFYLGKKFNDNYDENTANILETSELKRIKLKDSLPKSFLLKRSSEILLIIIFLISGLLALSGREPTKALPKN